jgi:hypothetical protein
MSSTKVREKMAGKMRSMRLLAVLLVSMIALIMGVAAPQAWATGFICVDEDGDPMGLDESKVFFEYSSSVKSQTGKNALNLRLRRPRRRF